MSSARWPVYNQVASLPKRSRRDWHWYWLKLNYTAYYGARNNRLTEKQAEFGRVPLDRGGAKTWVIIIPLENSDELA